MKVKELLDEQYSYRVDDEGEKYPTKHQPSKAHHKAAAEWHSKEHKLYASYKGSGEANKTHASNRADEHKRMAEYHSKKAAD